MSETLYCFFCRSRSRRRRRCLSSLLKWLCHGCLLHFVTIVTRIRLIKAFPWGESMTGLRKWRRPSLAIFFIYIVYLLSFVFRVFLFSVSNYLLFCFYLGFLLIFHCWGFREGLRMILPQARNHLSRRNVNDVIQLAWFQFAKEGMTRKGSKRSC